MSTVEITDNSDEFIKAMREGVEAALEAIGEQAVTYAKNIIAEAGRIGTTGALRNGIDKVVATDEEAVYIGTNLYYAVYHEMGTGVYLEGGGGRQGWWVYVPGSSRGRSSNPKTYTREEAARIAAWLQKQGIDAHITQGIKPIHFLRNAMQDHQDEYRQIAEQIIKEHQP